MQFRPFWAWSKRLQRSFFCRDACHGGIAVSLGIIMGCFLSQLITAMLLSTYDQPFKFTFPLYTDTLLFTLLFFGLAFGLIGCLNIRSIRRIKIIDMLHADKKTETDYKSSAWMSVWVILAAATAALMLFRGFISSGNSIRTACPKASKYLCTAA